jgi:hypothetical protein
MNRVLLLFIPVGAALAVPIMTLVVLFIEALTSGEGALEAANLAFRTLWHWTLSEGAIYNRRYERFLVASAVAFFLGCLVALPLFLIGSRRKLSDESR